MNKTYTGFLTTIISVFLFASFSFSASLNWSPVASTDDCTIAGYKIHYGTTSGQYDSTVDVGDATTYDLDLLNLTPTQTYYFAVSAYSTTNLDGPLSSPVPYRDSPEVSGTPVVDYTNNSIDITFNESSMQGAFTKENYSFSPTLIFDSSYGVILTDKTYRLYFNYIPERTIINLTLNNITDNNGNPVINPNITLNDSDNDGLADDWEAAYSISSADQDADSDGVSNIDEFTNGTNPLSADSDNDGMSDSWEIQNNLDPMADDADEDADNDGTSNLEEYVASLGGNNGGGNDDDTDDDTDDSDDDTNQVVTNQAPDKPVLSSPVNNDTNTSLTPTLEADSYADADSDAHEKTQWQISTENSFENVQEVVFDLKSHEQLTSLDVPSFILDPGKTYYWRLRFYDIQGNASEWSDPFNFTTQAVNAEDINDDGVPDVQQVADGTIDLNDDKVYDVATDTYKMVTDGKKQFAMEASNNVVSIDYMRYIDPKDIPDNIGKPAKLPMGLIDFRIKVQNPGDAATVRIYFSKKVGPYWYKYDIQNGWTEYSADYPDNFQLSANKKSVLLRLVDGGAGDTDGIANGVIVDPSGPSEVIAGITSPGSSVGADGGGGCFIATAAFGSQLETHVQILRDFRDFYLLKSHAGTVFVKTYYKYSPPIADIIAKNKALRAMVRIALLPLIAYGYIAVYLTPVQQLAAAFMLFGLMTWSANKAKRFYIRRRRAVC